ncbi:hypothetical protein ACV1DY_13780 [Aeromonas caviae]|jgi:hypothetical protein|uniref:Uncharacterized protein n=1 Tax=Aeromonas hydrophila subsp. hydrophila (strain ATCC 7966 / DSM 30187 / BCRC 13018 / CCUG 14551 / JCM 1027 / KCTC 2358 / NCIMB 9240 / NCTC 8049) TaxID=380703 RepID=A0KH67_AERHH|nr:hypothetical protein [Aeromonas hydrophila]ABK36525.1 hypothetical protein AHA_1075 [Aeromonas hydrophila subsp. hydrophila ATCC 7966]MBS4670284.1 hypothetical protein [Aeromonas hydrophila]OOD33024.1 hypothetical protein BWP11_11115 [Aeromonas hydrophila]SUU21582.1 Uncharacterised protein [Aeromonas hydrophila]HEG4446292.1 hypothetical protein [Aeromonas hydrophila]
MSLNDFKQAPWRFSHRSYQKSALAISPAPEYASSEVLLASLYRTIGFSFASEGSVPQAGRDLDKRIQKLREKSQLPPTSAIVGIDAWNTVLHGILESPKLPNQSSKRFLQVTPLVSGTALFSGSARLSSNSWPAGSLIRRMICLGSKDQETAELLWKKLFEALSVDDNDDVFARWLEQETSAWNQGAGVWTLAPIPAEEMATLEASDFLGVSFLPARRFTKDLYAIMQAKDAMTRRQWTSLLEAVLRLAAVSHVTWLCDVHSRIWNCLLAALTNNVVPSEQEARKTIFPDAPQYMAYGGKALQGIKDKVSSYLTARLGINTLLWSLVQIGAPYEGDLSSSKGIAALCEHIKAHQTALTNAGTLVIISDIREQEARALLCKKGIGSNMLEFARHVLGQRQAAVPLLRGYDQGYILKKNGNSTSSPWVVSLGPVAVLSLVHCALAGMVGPRSIHRLGLHLGEYGVIVDKRDIARNDLGHQLRMLGLVLDSPDAESGMLLLPPFYTSKATQRNEHE